MDIEADYKTKMLKVPVVYLNGPGDFETWHVALRRLVKGYGMGDALLYTIPENQAAAMEARIKETAAKSEKALIIKKEMESKGEPVAPDHSYMNIDLTQEAPLAVSTAER